MKGRKPFRIVVAEPFAPHAMARLESVGDVLVLENPSPDTMIRALPEADALLVRSKAHVTARIIDAGKNLKVIGRASPTIDHIDLRAARRRDICVVYTPNAAVNSTAEFVVGSALALNRRLHYYDNAVRDGRFDVARHPVGHEMCRLTVGLLGVDPVSEKVAGIASMGFGCSVIYHDPDGEQLSFDRAETVGFEELLSRSDIVSVHLKLKPETRGILNAQAFERMKREALLINVTRGALVDTEALAEALRKRIIGGAAIDVFESEPLPLSHPLRRAPNCILTPHVAGATLDASDERYTVADDVVRVLQGEMPQFPAYARSR